MSEKVLTYQSDVRWEGARRGRADVPGRAAMAVGAPPEFQGSDDVWSPEHLTVAAVNTCMMLTFIAIAENSKVAFSAYASSATGTMEKVEGRGMVFTSITVRPRITVPATTDRGRLDRVLQMTKKNCFISNSLTASVALDPDIVTA